MSLEAPSLLTFSAMLFTLFDVRTTIALSASLCMIGVVSILCPPSADAEAPRRSGAENWVAAFPGEVSATVVSVFHWTGEVFAAYSGDGKIQLFDTASRQRGRQLSLSHTPPSSGEIFPDPVFRTGGQVVHLSKLRPALRLYDSDGTMQRKLEIASLSAHWVADTPRGFWVLGADPRTRLLEYVLYSRDGHYLDSIDSWLETEGENARYSASFFFIEGARRWELPAFFPFIHREAQGTSNPWKISLLDQCADQLSQSTLASLHEQTQAFGAPEPLGDGLREAAELSPVVLAATRTASEILFLMNGGVLGILDLDTEEVQCQKIPHPPAAPGWVPTSVAANESTIVILDRTLEGVGIRMLKRESPSSPTQRDETEETQR